MEKSIFIVVNEANEKYAEFLSALIAQKEIKSENNKEEKHDTNYGYMASVLTDKEYRDNKKEIAFSPDAPNYVIFIGDFKEAKNCMEYSNTIFQKYGMSIKWIGKRAVLNVEKSKFKTLEKEYEEFFELSKEKELNFEMIDFSKGYINKNEKKVVATGSVVAGSIIPVGPIIAAGGYMVSSGIRNYRRNTIKKDVMDQKYKCLVKIFYNDCLKKFLEN